MCATIFALPLARSIAAQLMLESCLEVFDVFDVLDLVYIHERGGSWKIYALHENYNHKKQEFDRET